MAGKRSNDIDGHVSTRLRAARLQGGFSQEDVSREIGVTFQQIQKYENGLNRISAGKLYQIAKLYQVEIGFFFEGIERINGKKLTEDIPAKLLACPHGIDLARSYLALSGHASRQLVIDIAQALARPRA